MARFIRPFGGIDMRNIFIRSIRLLLILLAIALLLSGGLWLAGHYYGDSIKQSLVRSLNSQLNMEIQVDDIQFSIFDHFPRASVRFVNVVTTGKESAHGGPFIRAAEISILLNLYNLLMKDYRVERLLIKNAFINLVIEADGSKNFIILKENTVNNANDFELALQSVRFSNVDIRYLHVPFSQEYLFSIPTGKMKGQFSTDNLAFDFDGSILSTYFRTGKTIVLENTKLDTRLGLSGTESGSLKIRQAEINTSGLNLEITGTIHTAGENPYVDLTVLTGKTNLQTILKLVPQQFLKPLEDYSLTGEVDFKAVIRGDLAHDRLPEIRMEYNLAKGRFYVPTVKFTLNDVSFKGTFSNGSNRNESTYHLILENVAAKTMGGTLNGRLEISDFTNPLVNVSFASQIDLNKFSHMYKIEEIESLEGNLEMDISFSNRLKSFRKFTTGDFITSHTNGIMKFAGMNLRLHNSPLKFNGLQGNFRFNNKDLLINSFSGKVSGSDFEMEGYFRNLLAYLFLPDEQLYIHADVISNQINLDELLRYKSGDEEQGYRLTFSEKISFDLNVEVAGFSFRKFTGRNIHGRFMLIDRVFFISNGTMNAMGGSVELEGTLNGTNPNLYTMNCQAGLRDVDIRQFFSEFGNFGQNNLTYNHLRGKVAADVQYKSTLSPALEVASASVFTLADITITDGELIGYTPLYALSKFISRKDLEHIRFSTLKNNIRIENRVVHIPQMEINSSTLYLSLYGKHDFDNITDYHIQMYLSDLLNRNKQEKRKEGEVIPGIFEKENPEDNARIFLSMQGPADSPTIRYDTRELKKKIANDLSEEKAEFKQAMRDEFRWLSNDRDSRLQDTLMVESDDSPDFRFSWDEVKADSAINPAAVPVKKKKVKENSKGSTDFIIVWDEEKDTIP